MATKKITKIMEKESALKVIDEIKNKIGGVDLDELCGEPVTITEDKEENDNIYKKFVQGVMCGLVYWDENENCLAQELISPVKSGEVELEKLYYKNKICLNDGKSFKGKNQAALTIETLAACCCRPTQVLGLINGQDIIIAMGCLNFFAK